MGVLGMMGALLTHHALACGSLTHVDDEGGGMAVSV
jgi:hypothetical protein